MFAVEWLKQGITVERETSALTNLADAVLTTRARAEAVAARHPRDEPDCFRLIDSTGAVLITFKFLLRTPLERNSLNGDGRWATSVSID
jgi:hypothetical protein